MDLFMIDSHIFLQLTLAILLGALIGTERSYARKTAGMRTFALVCLGSALPVAATMMYAESHEIFPFDILRMGAAIITGIGFIGAGLIIFHSGDQKIHGLTTAAGLWVVAGIGIAVGLRLYGLALLATFLTLFTFTVLWFIEQLIIKYDHSKKLNDAS
jgi:putative Mg2+ transporter-C (MgtC) family protein